MVIRVVHATGAILWPAVWRGSVSPLVLPRPRAIGVIVVVPGLAARAFGAWIVVGATMVISAIVA